MRIEQLPPRKPGISKEAMEEASRIFDERYRRGETGSVTVEIENGTTDRITEVRQDGTVQTEFIEDAGDYMEE